MSLWLVSPDGQSYQLKPGKTTLGRANSNSILVQDTAASRQHASIDYDGQRCAVRDNNSANGTFVSEIRVGAEGATFEAGDQLRIGQTIYTLTATEPEAITAGRLAFQPAVDTEAETGYVGVATDQATQMGQPPQAALPVAEEVAISDLVGKTLGKYRLVAQLGRGGMAEVYKAYQPGLERYVAIKVMHKHLSMDPDFVGRFQREALATGRLMHPNIVQALDFDQDAGIYYMVMQYIEGPTLKDERTARRQRGQGFSPEEIARMYLALCEAIDYAHSNGMVHRDIKPANVMLNKQGQVLLTDFGIARLMGGTQYTQTGMMTGTPAYMSPEQGEGGHIDERSDIYTMGVILYELVTGRVPYQAETPIATIMQHIEAPLPKATAVNPNVSLAVEQVIERAMAKKPADRYQSAGELARALREAVGLAPGDTLRQHPLAISAPPPQVIDELDPNTGSFTPVGLGSSAAITRSVPNDATQMSSSPEATVTTPSPLKDGLSPAMIGIIAVVALLVLGGLGYFIFGGNSDAPPPEAEDAQLVVAQAGTATAQLLIDQTAEAQIDADATAAAGEVQATATAQLQAQASATTAWLSADDDRDGLTNRQELELNTLPDSRDTDQDSIDDLDEIETYKTDPLKSDTDGDGLKDGFEVSQGLDPTNEDTDGDGLLDAQDPDPANTPTPTPTETSTPTETPLPTNTPLPADTPTPGPTSTPAPTATPLPPAVTPTPDVSRGRIAFQSNRDGNNEIYTVALNGSSPTNITNNPGSDDRSPAWSPNGQQITFVSWRDDQGVWVMNANGANQQRLGTSSGEVFDPAWAPDSRRIYFGDSVSGVEYINADGSDRQNLTAGKGRNPSVSPDGRFVLYTADDGGNFNLFRLKVGEGNAGYVTSAPASEVQPVLSPDGERVAFISAPSTDDEYGELYVMNLDGSDATLVVPGQNSHPAWSPDGSQIAFTSRKEGNDEIYLMNPDGTNVRNITNHPADDKHPTWSPP